MKNMEIRFLIQSEGFKYYQVAQHLGISESYISRLLRNELSDEWKEKITAAVQEMKNSMVVV